MTTPDAILILSALALLFGGFVTGVSMSRIRTSQPETPRYLSLAHQGAFVQAALLFGVAFALRLSSMPEIFNISTALVVSAAALLLFAKDIVNWRLNVKDEFIDRGAGYRMALAFGPLHLVGLLMLAAAVLSAF